jgi:hypothetical protein
MQLPPLDPDVADNAPSSAALTTTTRSTLSPICACSTWNVNSIGARRAFESHLARAKWMTEHAVVRRHLSEGQHG